jgi:hypothetical protein
MQIKQNLEKLYVQLGHYMFINTAHGNLHVPHDRFANPRA